MASEVSPQEEGAEQTVDICRRVTSEPIEPDLLAERIDQACPNCVCERFSVGRHGSPGRVEPTETLYSVLMEHDFEMNTDQLMIHMASLAERGGLSFLREAASDAEFRHIVADRKGNNPTRRLRAFGQVTCGAIQDLVARQNTPHRAIGERLYCVLDTDQQDVPHHVDVFATMPREVKNEKGKVTAGRKTAWRQERGRLVALIAEHVQSPDQFRGGAFVER